jgi:hypothetical protein
MGTNNDATGLKAFADLVPGLPSALTIGEKQTLALVARHGSLRYLEVSSLCRHDNVRDDN